MSNGVEYPAVYTNSNSAPSAGLEADATKAKIEVKTGVAHGDATRADKPPNGNDRTNELTPLPVWSSSAASKVMIGLAAHPTTATTNSIPTSNKKTDDNAVDDDNNNKASLPTIGSTTERTIQRYTRICCAHNYQQLHRILNGCWGFSLHLNVCGNTSLNYFINVRVIVFCRGRLYNFHVHAVPLAGTKYLLYDAFATFMDVIELSFREASNKINESPMSPPLLTLLPRCPFKGR
jgi:hypothetical protein